MVHLLTVMPLHLCLVAHRVHRRRVCSVAAVGQDRGGGDAVRRGRHRLVGLAVAARKRERQQQASADKWKGFLRMVDHGFAPWLENCVRAPSLASGPAHCALRRIRRHRSCRSEEEHTSELQSLMRISYAVFCLKKKKTKLKRK